MLLQPLHMHPAAFELSDADWSLLRLDCCGVDSLLLRLNWCEADCLLLCVV